MLGRPLARLLVLLLLVGVAVAGVGPNVWLDVPFIKQEKNGCGAASLAMIIEYWRHQQGRLPGPKEDASQIQHLLYSQRVHGIYASALERFLSEVGFRSFAFHGEWIDLESNLVKGRPLILALKPAGRSEPLHYVVLTGIDQEQGVVLINDPARRKLLKQDRSDFEKQWKAAGNWTLLAIPDE
jgi:ABC-type bacteriocin/lantibiotic exporter with double-glycine peptidase domain